MISKKLCLGIEQDLLGHLDSFLTHSESQKLLSGKESGHVMGSIIEEKCGDLLQDSGYTITKELDSSGKEKIRALSDFIINSKNKKHLVNVKFSNSVSGQPNVCSMGRLLDALKGSDFDSYYILKVQYDKKTKKTKVYFVDILDYIDCLTFNGGTGQIMLIKNKFYKMYNSKDSRKKSTLIEKKHRIYDMYISKMEEHIQLKGDQLAIRREEFESL